METNKYIGYVEQVPFFGVLSLDEKQMLSKHARMLAFSIGQTIQEKDDIPQYLYCVVSGEIRMIDERPDGSENSLGLLKDGDSFGWEGDEERPGNPVVYSAAGNARVLAIPIETLRELFAHNPGLKQLLVTYMSSRAVTMFLRRTELLSIEDHQAVRKFLERMTVIHAEKGQSIVRQGDVGDAFFIVHTGQCEVVNEEDGTVINRLISGDFFGELALLTGARRKATVIAAADAQLFRLSKNDFDAMIVQHPALRTAIESIAIHYVSETSKYDDDDATGEIAAASSHAVRWAEIDRKRPFRFRWRKYPIRLQQNEMDCGPTCLAMVMAYYGSRIPINRIREQTEMSRSGSTLYGLMETAESLGLAGQGFTTRMDALSGMKLPAIAHWKGEHFIVVYEVTPKHVIVGDPAYGLERKTRADFEAGWSGAILTLAPTDRLAASERMRSPVSRFLAYVTPNRKALISLLVLSLLVQLTALMIPIVTQVIVDKALIKGQGDLLQALLVGMLALSLCYMSPIRLGISWRLESL